MTETQPSTVYIPLEQPDSVAVAIFPHESAFIIMLGNIPEADATAAAKWLHDAAASTFSSVSQYGIRSGSVAHGKDVFVLVDGPEEKVLSFARDQLGCEASRIQ